VFKITDQPKVVKWAVNAAPLQSKIKGLGTVNPWLAAHRQLLFSLKRKEKGGDGKNLTMRLHQ